MRAAFLITDLQPGGTPLRLAQQARALQSLGTEVMVGCLSPRGPVSDALERDGVETFACDAKDRWDAHVFDRLRAHLLRWRPDVIHTALTHANVTARLIAPSLGIPVVGSTATIEVERAWHRWIERATIRRDTLHVVNNDALATHVHQAFKLPRSRICVVPPMPPAPVRVSDPAAARRSLGISCEPTVLLWIGRLDPVKRVDWLIDLAESSASDVHVIIVGAGLLSNAIERRVDESPARDRIHLTGWLTDLSNVFSAADAFVLPSRTEGVPNVVLQAMSAHVPVIATDLPTLRALRDEGAMMHLIDAQSSSVFAANVRRLLSQPDACRAVVRPASDWVQSLSDNGGAAARLNKILERASVVVRA